MFNSIFLKNGIIEAVTCDSAKDEKIIRNISKATMISKEGSLST
jgi:hypothetical protein